MRRWRSGVKVRVVEAALVFGFAGVASVVSATVQESIEMTLVGSPLDLPPAEWPASTSPDGRHDAFVVYSGDVAQNVNRYRIMVADRVGGAFSAPRTVFSVASHERDNKPGIVDLRWANSHDLIGLVADRNGMSQVRRIDIRSGKSANLTSDKDGIVDFAASRAGNVLAIIKAPVIATKPTAAAYAGRIIMTETPYALISGRAPLPQGQGFGGGNVVTIRSRGKDTPVALPSGELPLSRMGLSVSPSGRFVIIPVGMLRLQTPSKWVTSNTPASWVFFYGLRLYDRANRQLRWLVDEPTMWEAPIFPIWSEDERAVFTSSRASHKDDNQNESVSGAIIAVDSGQVLASTGGRLAAIGSTGHLLGLRIAESDRPQRQYEVSFAGGGWKFVPTAPGGIAIRLRQDMNHPPVLVSHSFATGQEQPFLDLNPRLETEDVEVRQYSWTLKDGTKATVGLYLPAHRTSGAKFPLIVQTHGWDASQFWYDGVSTAGFAGRSLAQNGFIVVQMGGLPQSVPLADEAAASAGMIDDLVDALDRDGLVDSGRLGVTAWSATGLPVRYLLAFSRHHFGAAALVDSRDGGHMSYLLADPSIQDVEDKEMGGMPYGAGLEAWRTHSPQFNIDRVQTPIRLLSLGPYLLSSWEQWASMRRLGKPIEFVWLPSSNHWPIKPLERMEVQQGTIDWYRFWLQKIKDSSPAKVDQYRRWEAMRN